MMKPACGNCGAFKRLMIGQTMGLCRSRAPVPILVGMINGDGGPMPVVNTYFPQVPDNEWCGDYMPLKALTVPRLDLAELESALTEGNA